MLRGFHEILIMKKEVCEVIKSNVVINVLLLICLLLFPHFSEGGATK